MKKNKVKLTENGLKKLIKESTAKILKEMEMYHMRLGVNIYTEKNHYLNLKTVLYM